MNLQKDLPSHSSEFSLVTRSIMYSKIWYTFASVYKQVRLWKWEMRHSSSINKPSQST